MKKNYILILLSFVLMVSCSERKTYTPKPRGYFRIDFPKHSYKSFDSSSCPYLFAYPTYTVVELDKDRNAEAYWYNIQYKSMKATIHISYRGGSAPIIAKCLEDAHELAYKHTVKADAIDEQQYVDSANRVFGMVYDIRGNAASPLQFFLTDSSSHFVRGALYFNLAPNKDSLSPVVDFIRADVVRFIESVRWRSNTKQ